MLYDAAADRLTAVNRVRAETRYVPASTFKIANSLIALETGVVQDETSRPLRRQAPAHQGLGAGHEPARGHQCPMCRSTRRSPAASASSATAIGSGGSTTATASWGRGRQVLARRPVGNQRRGAGEVHRPPRTPGAAASSRRSQAIVRDILQLESGEGFVLYGKTGWQSPIGMVGAGGSSAGEVSAFALNIDMVTTQDAQAVFVGKRCWRGLVCCNGAGARRK